MKASIITIGDEILYGQTINTNAAWMSQRLSESGIRVHEVLTVADEMEPILEAFEREKRLSDIILITGGIGPTKDDLTKNALAKFFKVELKLNPEILNALEQFFSKRGLPLTENNRQQAAVPANCIALKNNKGTAWGMWFQEAEKVFVSMPGVPYEMEALMTESVIPKLKETFQLPVIVHKHILTAAIPESFLSEKLETFEAQLPRHIKLAYLPSWGTVKLRLTASGNDAEKLKNDVEAEAKKIQEVAGKYTYGYDNDVFEAAIGKILLAQKKTICTAESCTGGHIAQMITSVAGSSQYFKGAIVSYANEAKQNLLGVSENTLKQYGAVSEETVKEMIKGATSKLNTDYAIAVSGIAGPSGGTPEKPVGTVWIAVGSSEKIFAKKYTFPGDRERNIKWTSVVALEMMRKYLLGILS